ncbi:MAG: fumarylacetoacetate hydrolase family protein [Dehalococcoidia bacterium]
MKIARYEVEGRVAYGMVEDGSIREIQGGPFDELSATGETYSLKGVKLLTPASPSKVLAVGLNYASHLGDRKSPEEPGIFLKSPSALLEPEGTILLPSESKHVEHEGELVVVMGRKAHHVSPENALEYVLGYTCGNDVSARPWQRNDLQWWRAKASDTFAPLGPYIATDLDPGNLDLEVRINGEIAQQGNTSDLIFDVPAIISFISRCMTLEPGDVIYTGTPGIPGSTKAGDVVEVEISGIGILRNHVADGG